MWFLEFVIFLKGKGKKIFNYIFFIFKSFLVEGGGRSIENIKVVFRRRFFF